MIDTNSLRRGNLLLHSNYIVQVDGIGSDFVFCHRICELTFGPINKQDSSSTRIDIQYLLPIVLSDILLQQYFGLCSIEPIKAFRYPNTGSYQIYVAEEGGYFVGLNNRGKIQRVTPKPFNSFHAFQNIYYAMYECELVVNFMNFKNAILLQ